MRLKEMKGVLSWGAVTSWLVSSPPDRAVRVQALAGDIVLCSWARHFTLTVSLSTQVYKWAKGNLMLGVTLRWTSTPSRGEEEILQVASCYWNRTMRRGRPKYGPLGCYKDFGPLTHVFWQLKRQHFMTYESYNATTVRGFSILPEVSLRF